MKLFHSSMKVKEYKGQLQGLIIGGVTGVIGGMFLRLGWEVYQSRPTTPGGEIMIIPLMLLMFYCGGITIRNCRILWKWKNTFEKGYRAGYNRAIKETSQQHINCRHTIHPYDYENEASGQ